VYCKHVKVQQRAYVYNFAAVHPQEQATIIRIPLSLSDVYMEGGDPTTWYIDDKGVIRSMWSFGGSFFRFLGKSMRSGQTGNRLATINESLTEGSYRIPVRHLMLYTAANPLPASAA
jgi:hypothetical protein